MASLLLFDLVSSLIRLFSATFWLFSSLISFLRHKIWASFRSRSLFSWSFFLFSSWYAFLMIRVCDLSLDNSASSLFDMFWGRFGLAVEFGEAMEVDQKPIMGGQGRRTHWNGLKTDRKVFSQGPKLVAKLQTKTAEKNVHRPPFIWNLDLELVLRVEKMNRSISPAVEPKSDDNRAKRNFIVGRMFITFDRLFTWREAAPLSEIFE